MVHPIIEECYQRFHSLNGTAISIEGTAKWMEVNSRNAEEIMTAWKEVFANCVYSLKLYLFYVANYILVQERSSNRFIYSAYLNDVLPMMTRSSLDNIQNEEIAKKILNTIRLWKDKHTIGRTMTNSIITSIPQHVFKTFPEFADLNPHAGEMEDYDYYTSPDTNYHETDHTSYYDEKDKELERIPLDQIPVLQEQCQSDIKEILEIWRNDYVQSPQSKEQRKEMQMMKKDLEEMTNDFSTMQGSNYEDIEMTVSKRDIQTLCFDVLKICKEELNELQKIDELIDQYIEKNVEYQQEDNQRFLERVIGYVSIIEENQQLLERESIKRQAPPIEDLPYKRDNTYY